MKKLLAFTLAMIFAVVPFFGCGAGNGDGTETVKSGKLYRFYEKENDMNRYLEIYNSEGKTVHSEKTLRPIDVNEIDEDLIEITVGYGTGLAGHRYYSAQRDLLSEEIFYVIANYGSLVVYLDGELEARTVAVRDAFEAEPIFIANIPLPTTTDMPIIDASLKPSPQEENMLVLTVEYRDSEGQKTAVWDITYPQESIPTPEERKAELAKAVKEYKRIVSDYEYFTLVDLDGNGVAELCLDDGQGNGCEAFKYEDGTLKKKGLYCTRELFLDGSCLFKENAGSIHGNCRYINGEYVEIDREDVSGDKALFYIGGVLVNAEETAAYIKNCSVGYAEWYSAKNPEVVDFYITVENLYLREPPKYVPKNQKFMQYSDIVDMLDELWLSSKKDAGALYETYKIPENEDDRAIFDALLEISRKSGFIGYDAEDINGDGYPELVFLTEEGEVYGIFTVLEGLPILVGVYGSAAREYSCFVNEDGELILDMYASGENCVTKICEISKGGELSEKLSFGCYDADIDDSAVEYYKKDGAIRSTLSYDEYSELAKKYSAQEQKGIDFEFSELPGHPRDEMK